MKKKNIIIIAIIGLLILFSPYIKAEYLTLKHGKEFEGLEQQTEMLNPADYLKVISYSEKRAEVFYASDTGDLISFVKVGKDNWEMLEWKTVWSTSGSAGEFMWPYYR